MREGDEQPGGTATEPLFFGQTWRVGADDLDDLRHVNNVRYLQRLQDVAIAHWALLADAAQQAAYVWVARRHELDYLAPAFLGEELRIETHVCLCHGALCTRIYHITRAADHKTILTAQTQWCLLDKHNLRPMRIPKAVAALFFRRSAGPVLYGEPG